MLSIVALGLCDCQAGEALFYYAWVSSFKYDSEIQLATQLGAYLEGILFLPGEYRFWSFHPLSAAGVLS